MIQKTYSVVSLKADEGMWLTDNSDIIEGRSFCKEVITPNPDNWKEVSTWWKEQWEEKYAPAVETADAVEEVVE